MTKNKMRRRWLALLIIAVLCSTQTAAQSPDSAKPAQVNTFSIPEINNKTNFEKESAARRGEIVFLISLPFTAIMSVLLVNGVYYVSNPAYNFTMTKLPHEMIPFAIFSAVFSSSIIAWADYRTVQSKKKISAAGADSTGSIESGENRELHMGAMLQKKF